MHDYKAMTVFVTVVECGSMQAAAEKLSMTPSAVTQTIQKLETQLNIKLLHRTTRKLSLTEAGEAFYEHAVEIQKSADNAVRSVELLRSRPSGQLNIACATGLTDSLFVNVFKSVLNSHPDFRLNLIFEDKLTDLQEKRIDIALRAGKDVLDNNMIARPVYNFEMVMVASPDYLADKPAIHSLNDIEKLDWISFSNPRFNTIRFYNGNKEQEICPEYRVHCNTLYASRRLTLRGLGISLQPNADVQQKIEQGELVRLLPEWRLPSSSLYLVTLQRIQSEKVRIASELILDYFKHL